MKHCILFAAISIALYGCGGSGGSSESPSEPPRAEAPSEQEPVVETSCVVSDVPHYGAVSSLGSNTVLERLHSLPDTSNQDFELTVNSGEYGFFAYPAALGRATFSDNNLMDIEGGWEGATWDAEGNIGESYEPVVATIDGAPWLIYRTDFPGIGDIDFHVAFENAGMNVGDSVTCDYSELPQAADFNYEWSEDVTDTPETPQEPQEPESPTAPFVSGLPMFGTSKTNLDFGFDISKLGNTLPSTEKQSFQLTIPSGEYGFFAYPAALGEASFIDDSVKIEGGWDGATWKDDGSIGMKYTPILVMRDNTPWFVYRTDFPSLGDVSFTVEFANGPLEVGDVCDCDDLSVYPAVSTGQVTGIDNIDTVLLYESGTFDRPVEIGYIIDGTWHVNATDLEDGHYDLYFAQSGSTELTTYGPVFVQVVDGMIEHDPIDASTLSVSKTTL